MHKVYLLLRNNQQTGPYHLEELLQFDLKPFDLIWIEGKSAGWYYPQEIPALQPHLTFLKPTTPPVIAQVQDAVKADSQPAARNVYVAMPFATKKEEVFIPAANVNSENTRPFVAETMPSKQTEELKTTYAKTLEEVEADYTQWIYQKKTKKKSMVSAKGMLAACLVAGLAFAAWNLLTPSSNPVETPLEQTAFIPTSSELPTDSAAEDNTLQETAATSDTKKQKRSKTVLVPNENKTVLKKSNAVIQSTEEKVAATTAQSNEYENEPAVKQNTPVTEEEKSAPVTAEAPKDKKKLKEKIFDLFKKKPEEKKEDAKPAEEENGQRQSTRREAGSSLTQMVTVRFDIPNEWMMGIKGAKATLTNRSSETIVKAVVEVIYYNDDNEVLDRKTVSFSGIKSRQTQTVAVPDHQTATRLEYNVVSATGAGEPFAKR
jgi:hypothetical protein